MFRRKDYGEVALIGAVFLLIFYGFFMVNVTFIYYWYNEERLDLQYVPGKFEIWLSNVPTIFRNPSEIQGPFVIHLMQCSVHNPNHNLHTMRDNRSRTYQRRNEGTIYKSTHVAEGWGLWEMHWERNVETIASASLQRVRLLYIQDGPPLSLD